MFHLGEPVWHIAVRALIVYAAFLLALRVFGKREVGQFTLYDLVLLLLVANAVQPAITGRDYSVTGGIVVIASLFLVNLLVAQLRIRVRPFRAALEGHPTVIGEDGKWFPAAMKRQGVDEEDAMMALREHGVESVAEARLVVLEVDGSISVVPIDGGGLQRSRRRVRTIRRG